MSRKIAVFALFLLVVGIVSNVLAQSRVTFKPADLSCEGVTITINYNYGDGFADETTGSIEVTDPNAGNIVIAQADFPVSITNGFASVTVTLTFDPAPTGDSIDVFASENRNNLSGSMTFAVDCAAPEEPETPVVITDGRFCFGPGAAPVALYSRAAGLDIYEVDGSDKGLLIARFTAADFEALPAKPSSVITLFTSDNGLINFYKLTSGEFQINVGPVESTNKVHVCRFSAIPDIDAVLTAFYLK